MTDENKAKGEAAEERFKKCMFENYNVELIKSSRMIDIRDGYDFSMKSKPNITYDVKHQSRAGDNFVYITLYTKYKDSLKKGSIFSDKLTFFAFECEEFFIIVNRKQLLNYITSNIDIININPCDLIVTPIHSKTNMQKRLILPKDENTAHRLSLDLDLIDIVKKIHTTKIKK